jgi:hypothetical protein
MAYIVTKNPAGKNPNRGWAPNLRGLGAYVVTKNPVGKDPNRGWRPGLRGMGCDCKKTLGQDDLSMFGVAADPIAAAGATVNYPAAPGSGLDYIPSTAPNEYSPSGASSYWGTGITPVFNNPQSSPLSIPSVFGVNTIPTTAASATSPVGGLSMSTIIVGGLVVAALLVVMKKK